MDQKMLVGTGVLSEKVYGLYTCENIGNYGWPLITLVAQTPNSRWSSGLMNADRLNALIHLEVGNIYR